MTQQRERSASQNVDTDSLSVEEFAKQVPAVAEMMGIVAVSSVGNELDATPKESSAAELIELDMAFGGNIIADRPLHGMFDA